MYNIKEAATITTTTTTQITQKVNDNNLLLSRVNYVLQRNNKSLVCPNNKYGIVYLRKAKKKKSTGAQNRPVQSTIEREREKEREKERQRERHTHIRISRIDAP